MIGHAQIIAARSHGLKPQAIFIDAGFDPLSARFDFEKPEMALAHKLYPTVTIPPQELGRRLDLRFVAGCRVHVHGRQLNDALLDLVDTVAQAGAHSIVVCADANNELMEYKNGEWAVYAN